MKGNLADLKFMVSTHYQFFDGNHWWCDSSWEKLRNAGMGDLRIVFVQSFLHGGVPFKFYYLFKMIL